MKFKLVVVDLEMSHRARHLAAIVVASLVALAGGAIAYASLSSPPRIWNVGDVLGASDLNAAFSNLSALDTRITTLEGKTAVTPIWSSYLPTITSDGTATASRLVRGGSVNYVRFGTTVCLQGHITLGYTAPGTGGTFIKVSLPVAAKAGGASEYGIGTVVRIAGSATSIPAGSGAIEGDKSNIILAKSASGSETSYFTDGDAPTGYGLLFSVNGCYQTD